MRALLVEKDEDSGKTHAAVKDIAEDDLPAGEVTVAVEYSTLNYKDGLCIGPGGGLVRSYPHVPGIDFAGTVESSDDDRYAPGDKVVLTGWRVGEAHWGGYAEKARVKADWLVPLPSGLDTHRRWPSGPRASPRCLRIMALEDHGLKPGQGPVLVTGASGGVGSVATAILGNLGYEVAAVTGRPDNEAYLKGLGATTDRAARGDRGDRQAPARGGGMGGLHRRRGRPDAGARSGADEIRLLRRGRGACRRRGPARNGDPVPAARREPAWNRQRHAALRRSGARRGSGSPATCRGKSSRR